MIKRQTSVRNMEQLLPFAEDAEAMLQAKFKYSQAKAQDLVAHVILHFWRRPDASFKNPRRVLMHTCHGWAARGGVRRSAS